MSSLNRPVVRRILGQADLVRRYLDAYGPAGLRLLFDVRGRGKGEFPLFDTDVKVRVRRGSSDRNVFNQVFVYREYDHPELPASAELIVDAGANVGYSAVFFACKYPGATVVAIEPEDANFEALQANTRRHPSIKPLKAALWPTRTELAIADPKAEAWAFQTVEAKGGGVPATTISDILDEYGRDIDILKIDIEGAERELFEQGAEAWLGRVGTLVIELHDHLRPGCSEAVTSALGDRSSRRFTKGENVFYQLRAPAAG